MDQFDHVILRHLLLHEVGILDRVIEGDHGQNGQRHHQDAAPALIIARAGAGTVAVVFAHGGLAGTAVGLGELDWRSRHIQLRLTRRATNSKPRRNGFALTILSWFGAKLWTGPPFTRTLIT